MQVQTQFVRAHTWALGPIRIQKPVMMTMALDGLVRGGPMDGDVIGIIGYDLFRCVQRLGSHSSHRGSVWLQRLEWGTIDAG